MNNKPSQLSEAIARIDAEAMHCFPDIALKFLPKGNPLDCDYSWMYRSDDKTILFDINKEDGEWWLNGAAARGVGLVSLISYIDGTSNRISAIALAYTLKMMSELNFIVSEGVSYE